MLVTRLAQQLEVEWPVIDKTALKGFRTPFVVLVCVVNAATAIGLFVALFG